MPASPALRGRYAVGAMFFANGFLTGAWAPQIPIFLTRLQISEFTLGLLILVFGIGALTAMPWCGFLLHRYGSRTVLRGFAAACAFALLVVALAGNVWVAAVAMFLFGALIGGMDVAMNAGAVSVEQKLGRAVMSSSHGFWSLGGFAGSASGGFAIAQYGYLNHAFLVTAVTATIVAVAAIYLLVDEPHAEARAEPYRLPRKLAVYLTGVIALFSMIPEGAVLDWAALYLQQELGSDISRSGLAFAAFSAAMATMRFLGDGVRNRFGAVTTLRFSALIAATGMAVAGFAPNDWVAVAAFAMSGLGVANMVPIAFSAAGNHPGTLPGAGLSTVTLMGYSGILVAPSAIGFIGERTGFAPVYVGLALMLVIVSLMAPIARPADFKAAGPAQ
ncbi:MAG: MFS transporter [Rhizobiaceae bacterium]|nr:MFS transporter [Rhizobiaceae bacterium]